MGLYEGQGQLSKGLKDLLLRWQAARQDWRDAVAESFEKDVLQALERDVHAAAAAMDQMAGVVRSAKRDCS